MIDSTVALALVRERSPWPQIVGPNFFYDTHPVGRLHARQLREPDGLYRAFLATLWEDRDRVIPLRGTGGRMLPERRARRGRTRQRRVANRRNMGRRGYAAAGSD